MRLPAVRGNPELEAHRYRVPAINEGGIKVTVRRCTGSRSFSSEGGREWQAIHSPGKADLYMNAARFGHSVSQSGAYWQYRRERRNGR